MSIKQSVNELNKHVAQGMATQSEIETLEEHVDYLYEEFQEAAEYFEQLRAAYLKYKAKLNKKKMDAYFRDRACV